MEKNKKDYNKKQTIETNTDLNQNHIGLSSESDVENAVSKIAYLIDEQQKNATPIKTNPKNRWFYSIMTFLIIFIFIVLGVIIVCLVVLNNPSY